MLNRMKPDLKSDEILLTDEGNIIIPPNSPDALAFAIKAAMSILEMKKGKTAEQSVQDVFDENKSTQTIR